jgi:hypothetical protein
MVFRLILTILVALCLGCTNSVDSKSFTSNENSSIVCNEKGCSGSYRGNEFVNGLDVAHQFSNEMADKVGDKLKELYRTGIYSKVHFSKIEMSTEGMGSGKVVYFLKIPFERVQEKCDAYTSFDHVGGWDHSPALSARKKQLQSVLMSGESLEISELKVTPEGLQEYWIQWKNKNIQSDCTK